MGLSAVYGTMKSHGGAVTAESVPGKGSVFRLLLPENREESADAAPPPAPLEGTARVLVVDDEMVMRDMAAEALRDLGYKVHACADGAEAVRYYEQHWREIDLVLLDFVMPQINGRDAFHAMRRVNPGIRAVILSGYNLIEEAQRLLDDGAAGFLQKPFRVGALTEAIRKALEGRGADGS